jgi:hypothetical protein
MNTDAVDQKTVEPDPEREMRETLLAVRAKLKVALHLSQDRVMRRRRRLIGRG